MTKVDELKLKLYDAIEAQAMHQNEIQRIEQIKAELARQLGQARQLEQQAAQQPETADPKPLA